MKIKVVSGDIARVPADALITAINSGGAWFGGIDGVIVRNAGKAFHEQAAAAMPLQHGQVVVARGNGSPNLGLFRNVVFVVDDLRGRLADIVYNGLVGASEAGFALVTLPTIRMGVMLGIVEKSKAEAVAEMAGGVQRFLCDHPTSQLSEITFVVWGDAETKEMLEKGMRFN